MSEDQLVKPKAKKRSKDRYEQYWDGIIEPCIDNLTESSGVTCRRKTVAKRKIWKAYKAFNRHCSENYMLSPEKPLDRHKVAACYIYAVLAAFPLEISDKVDAGSWEYLSNERLAMMLGCSILASFDLRAVRKTRREDPRLDDICDEVRKGVKFPESTGCGDYETNMLSCLSFMVAEKNYNILLLATLLYHWEELIFVDYPDVFKEVLMCRE